MLERFLVKIGIFGLLVVIVIAVISTAGCGTVAGFGRDLQGASDGIAKMQSHYASNESGGSLVSGRDN